MNHVQNNPVYSNPQATFSTPAAPPPIETASNPMTNIGMQNYHDLPPPYQNFPPATPSLPPPTYSNFPPKSVIQRTIILKQGNCPVCGVSFNLLQHEMSLL